MWIKREGEGAGRRDKCVCYIMYVCVLCVCIASFPGSTSQLFFAPLILLRAKKSWEVEPGNEATCVVD